MKSSHTFRADSAVFDETNLVSSAGLVPVLELAEQAGLSELIDVHVDIDSVRVKSGAANPVGKLTSIIAGMCTGADVIDDMNLLRAGGMPALFDQVYAPSTLGIVLREFTFGHSLQLGAVLRRHLIALTARTPLLPGIEERAFLDIDSLLRPVYGHAKVSGRTVLRKGLNPLVTTLSTVQAAPVVASDAAARRQDRLRPRRRLPAAVGDHHRPCLRRDGQDHGPRRLGVRPTWPSSGPRSRPTSSSP